MPRMPVVIFGETVVAGAILFLSPLLKSTAPIAQLSLPLRTEQHRTQQLKQFGSTAGRVLTARSSHPELSLSIEFGGTPVAEPGSANFESWMSISAQNGAVARAGPLGRLSGLLDRARCYSTRWFERSWCSLRNKETLPACYSLSARRHAPGLTPTMRVKCSVK
jgi:hypothetical protein